MGLYRPYLRTRLARRFLLPSQRYNGFSLAELLLSAAISSIVIIAATTIAISETKSSIKSYVLQSLRDKYSKLSYLIDSEITEGKGLSLVYDQARCSNFNPNTNPEDFLPRVNGTFTGQYLFTVAHTYASSQSATPKTVYSCYYNVPAVANPGTDPNNYDLWRLGPAIGDHSGVIGTDNGIPGGVDSIYDVELDPGLSAVSRYTYIYNVRLNNQATCPANGSCDGRTLSYSMKVGSGSSKSIWGLTYPPGGTDVTIQARTSLN